VWDLLILRDEIKTHFTYIKDFSRLLRRQIPAHKNKMYICRACFSHYHSQEKIEKHWDLCMKYRPAEVVMPGKENYVEFKCSDFKMTQYVPYVIYADLECYLSPGFDNFKCTACHSKIDNREDFLKHLKICRYTSRKQLHKPSSYAYLIRFKKSFRSILKLQNKII